MDLWPFKKVKSIPFMLTEHYNISKKHLVIWNRTGNQFDAKVIRDDKDILTKTKIYKDKLRTDFHDDGVHQKNSMYSTFYNKCWFRL